MLDPLADEYVQTEDADPSVLFTDAYRSFSAGVLAYLRSRGVDDPEAVTQDVFMAFYPKLDNLRGGLQGAKALIFAIAHARMVDHYRRCERAPALSPYEAEFDGRRSASAEDQAISGANGLGAAALLEDLSEDHREVLALRVIADLSVEQVAAIMGKTPGAVKQLQRRALCALRDSASITKQGTS